MTKLQANQIKDLRLQGAGYKSIGSVVGLSRDIVRNYCKANGLDGYVEAVKKNVEEQVLKDGVCLNCNGETKIPHTGRPKKFCSEQCRRYWWNAHPEEVKRKPTAFYQLTCKYCGSSFESYGNNKQKYCSHNCYIRDRFWREEDGVYEAKNC